MRVSALLVPAFLAAVIASACSNQGEGDFCDANNGNNDCETGLQCMAAPGLSGGLVNRDRCCPIPPAQATTSACALNTSNILDGSMEVPDAFALGVPDAAAGAETGAPEAGAAEAGAAETGVPDATVAPVEGGAVPDAAGADGTPE